MKTLGYKVSDEFYFKIKKEYRCTSSFLRNAVHFYLNSKVNQVNSNYNQETNEDKYQTLIKFVDSLEMPKNDI